MHATLGRAEDYRDTIVRFRTTLGRQIGFAKSCADPAPLPYAFYLFAWDASGAEPSAMAELFFYDQAFDSYSACPHAEAFDLEHLAPMDRVIHLRSLVGDECEHRAELLRCLGQAITQLARCLGTRFMTADPQLLETSFVSECQAHGSPRTGGYETNGAQQMLSLVSLKASVDAASTDATQANAIDPLLLRTIRLRGRRALEIKKNAAARLDALLPAHWVGVWQRQLLAYAL
jgi:hypothetical protein